MKNNNVTIDRIKKLEFASGFVACMAPIIAAMINFDRKLIVLLIIGGLAVALQPYIYYLYKKIGQTDEFKRKRFWPAILALLFISFLVLKRYFNWDYF